MPGRQTGKARDSEFRNWRFESAPGSYCPLAKRLRHGTLTAAYAGSNPARAVQEIRSVRLSWKGRETPDLLMWVRVPRGVLNALFVQWIGQRIPNPQKQVRILYRVLWICSKTVMQRAFNP